MLLRAEEGVGGEVVVGGEGEMEVQGEDGEVEGVEEVVGEAEEEEEGAGEVEVGVEEEEAEDQAGDRAAAATTASIRQWNQPTPQFH